MRKTVCVKDAVRAMLFLSEKEEAKGEIFHAVCENFKIRELAKKVSPINPSTKIEYIAKEVPFSSYHLSNKKIKGLGFSFEWNLELALKEMAGNFGCLKK
jgi:nucleoside-diphosphate-sugar epimerase